MDRKKDMSHYAWTDSKMNICKSLFRGRLWRRPFQII